MPESFISAVRFAAESAWPGCGRIAWSSGAKTRSVPSWPSTDIAAEMSAVLSSIRRSSIASTSMPSMPSVPLISARPSLAASWTGSRPAAASASAAGIRVPDASRTSPSPISASAQWDSGARSPEQPSEPYSRTTGVMPWLSRSASSCAVAGRTPVCPVVSVESRSSISPRTTSRSTSGPEPAACERTSERCSWARMSVGMCRVASAPKPVEMPYAGVGAAASSSTTARARSSAVTASASRETAAPSRATATRSGKDTGPVPRETEEVMAPSNARRPASATGPARPDCLGSETIQPVPTRWPLSGRELGSKRAESDHSSAPVGLASVRDGMKEATMPDLLLTDAEQTALRSLLAAEPARRLAVPGAPGPRGARPADPLRRGRRRASPTPRATSSRACVEPRGYTDDDDPQACTGRCRWASSAGAWARLPGEAGRDRASTRRSRWASAPAPTTWSRCGWTGGTARSAPATWRCWRCWRPPCSACCGTDRPARLPDCLTLQERRVLNLVGAGWSNAGDRRADVRGDQHRAQAPRARLPQARRDQPGRRGRRSLQGRPPGQPETPA